MTIHGILFLAGIGLVVFGERTFTDDLWRFSVDGAGVALVLASLALRFQARSSAEGNRREALQVSLAWACVGAASLLLYVLGLDLTTEALGLSAEGAERWSGVLLSLMAVVFVVGTSPMLLLDLALSGNPVVLPRDATTKAVQSGLITGLSIALVFPVNFVVHAYNVEYDSSYFKTSSPSGPTLALVSELASPVSITLLYPAGNRTHEEMRSYFDQLEAASGGLLTVTRSDFALVPELAERADVRDNGFVIVEGAAPADTADDEAAASGDIEPADATEPTDGTEATDDDGPRAPLEKVRIDEDFDRAKRNLKNLDAKIGKALLTVTRGERKAYFLDGHGEATPRTRDNPWRKLGQTRRILRNLGYDVEQLNVTNGSTESVPDDADVLFVTSPRAPLIPDELEAIRDYVQSGGRLFVTVNAGDEMLEPLLADLGLKVQPELLVDGKRRVPGLPPYVLATDRYGSHPVAHSVSRQRIGALLPYTVSFRDDKQAPGKRKVILRTFETVFRDANRNLKQDDGEEEGVFNVGFASEGPEETPWRAVVFGTVEPFSNGAYAVPSDAGKLLVADALRYLAEEEELVGAAESEDDVKIDHAPEGQTGWFWATVLGMPLLVLAAGGALVTTRRRRNA